MDVRLGHKEGWALKNWCFQTVVLEKTLENPLDCKEINQSILKEISPEYSSEGLMLKLKLWYFSGPTGKDPDAEEDWKRGKGKGGSWEWDGHIVSLTRWTWVWVNSRSWWWIGRPGMLRFMGSQRFGHDWVTELNWTERDPRLRICSL